MGNCCSKTLNFKTLVLGPIMSGKTTLLSNLSLNRNKDYVKEYIFYNRKTVNTFIESLDESISLNRQLIKQVDAIILVIDLSRIYSNIVDQLNAIIDFREEHNLNFCISIVGTKVDLANAITINNVREIANSFNFPFFMAFSKIIMDNTRVFDEITHELAHRNFLKNN